MSEHGVAIFHVGREEGCENYAVAFLESGTALVAMAVSPLRSTFTARLAAALIGDTCSPLGWLEYGMTAEARPSTRAAFLVAIVVLPGIAIILAVRYWRGRRRRESDVSGRTSETSGPAPGTHQK